MHIRAGDKLMDNVDTYESTETAAYENADRYHDNMLVSELIGTAMHIPTLEGVVEDEVVNTPMSATEISSLVGNTLFDWLID